MAEEYRMSLYLGAGAEGRALKDPIVQHGNSARFKDSEMEFVRHCIRFTLENDPTLKSKK